jgi:hypothetical protein
VISLLQRVAQHFVKANRPLTLPAFRMIFVARVLHHWPDVSPKMAEALFEDYLPEKFGHPGYDWTKAGAIDLADICVSDQCE